MFLEFAQVLPLLWLIRFYARYTSLCVERAEKTVRRFGAATLYSFESRVDCVGTSQTMNTMRTLQCHARVLVCVIEDGLSEDRPLFGDYAGSCYCCFLGVTGSCLLYILLVLFSEAEVLTRVVLSLIPLAVFMALLAIAMTAERKQRVVPIELAVLAKRSTDPFWEYAYHDLLPHYPECEEWLVLVTTADASMLRPEARVLTRARTKATLALSEETACKICYQNQRTHILVPCGHYAFCGECEIPDTCPLCRRRGHPIRVYES